MAIAHRRIGDQHALFASHPLAELLRAELVETLFGAVLDLAAVGMGTTGSAAFSSGRGLSLASGWPLTVTSAR
ncbi:hypothetical protein AJ87_33700 [Rhizobium yanglingense]|nr:hypothetical protein AJ87_33700 [Rhizobium yanglingense]